MFDLEKIDRLTAQLKRLNDHADWFREYVKKHELGECLNEGVDHLAVLAQVFTQVKKVEGGVGVVHNVLEGLRKFQEVVGGAKRETKG